MSILHGIHEESLEMQFLHLGTTCAPIMHDKGSEPSAESQRNKSNQEKGIDG